MYVSPFPGYLLPIPFSVRVFQRLYTNAVVWKQLRHPNLLSFLGFGSDSPFSLVYPWMPSGSLSNYVRKHPNVDRLHLVCGCSGAVVNFLNDPDRLLMSVIGRYSRVDLLTLVWSGSWELNRSEAWFPRPEMRGDLRPHSITFWWMVAELPVSQSTAWKLSCTTKHLPSPPQPTLDGWHRKFLE